MFFPRRTPEAEASGSNRRGGAVKSEALSKGASKSNVKTFYDVAYEPRLPVRSYVRIYGEATRHKEREGVGPDLKFDLRHRL